jgi:type VI secretion system Hcp family effector
MKNSSLINKLLFILFILFVSTIVQAELNANMYITGANQGLIAGDSKISGRTDSFDVNEIHHLFQKDSAGRTTIHPLIVTTKMSQGMPFLLKAFDTSETLDPVVIRYYRQNSSSGFQENYYTIIMHGVKIEMLEPIMLDNLDSNTTAIPARMRIRFNYTSIEHQYTSGTITQAYFLTN